MTMSPLQHDGSYLFTQSVVDAAAVGDAVGVLSVEGRRGKMSAQ